MKTNRMASLSFSCLILPGLLLVVGCDKTKESDPGQTTPPATNTLMGRTETAMKNMVDGTNNLLTAGDQGTSATDRELTQKIRQSVVSGANNYSMAAKNVKIITVDGKVTLRGTVSTTAEKDGIATLAKSIAGDASVDNQLEVKPAQ